MIVLFYADVVGNPECQSGSAESSFFLDSLSTRTIIALIGVFVAVAVVVCVAIYYGVVHGDRCNVIGESDASSRRHRGRSERIAPQAVAAAAGRNQATMFNSEISVPQPPAYEDLDRHPPAYEDIIDPQNQTTSMGTSV